MNKCGAATEKNAANGSKDEPAPAVDSAEEAFGKLLQLVRAVQSGMRNIDASHGLSGSQVWALWQISAQPGLRVTELAEAQQLHPSTASNLLDKLETHGLVRRERRDTDNRVVRLYLTDAGLELAKNLPGPLQGRLRQALRALPQVELAGLLNGVTSVLERMNASPR
ncbi:MAG: MarR family transcriptional regulator [Pseudomonadota bacterium]|nr:MarR family transcriptional regulator [Pseudomonadota bacterium]MDP1572912.1 MarR family transcriptional regulator [Pseudomonadota bacterium]MDP1906148.1 MarR family transcriptional regulator [Pseudomonadota bacterium]